MPRQKWTADQIQDEAEALFLEQAKACFRDLRQAAQNAPYGKIIATPKRFPFGMVASSFENPRKRRSGTSRVGCSTWPVRVSGGERAAYGNRVA